MKKTVFDKKDFILCNIPVPEGYPQSQTHVGVFPYDNKLFLTSSPFPVIKYKRIISYIRSIIRKITRGRLCPLVRGETYENPLLYISVNEECTIFKLVQTRPLMEQPDPYYGYPSFNSDPDIFIERDRLYILNRAIFRTKLTPGKFRDEYNIRIYLIEGLIDLGRFKLSGINLIKESEELSVSPCLTKYHGEYKYFELFTNCYNDGQSFDGLRYRTYNTINDLKNAEAKWNDVRIITSDYIPWHMSVFEYNGVLYAILACVKKNHPHHCYQMFGEFSNQLDRLTIYDIPLTDYNSYRGHAYVDNMKIFHLYTTTVNEKIYKGKSVDGREVLTASMYFDDFLKMIRQ